MPGDWIRTAEGAPGLARIEAYFSGHAYDPHRHDTYALGLTIAGVQCFDYRGARCDSLAGDAIVLHPDERHDGRAGVPAGFRYRMLYLEPRLVRQALGERAGGLPFVPAAVSSDARLVRALRRVLADLDAPPGEIEADGMVAELVEAMAAVDPAMPARRAALVDSAALDRARQHLDGHLERGVASAELEGVTGLDRFALARQFRSRFGTSPYHYLVMRRLDRARDLLRGGANLAEVAFACGFADQSHLTRQFRRAYGLTPGRWRALQRIGAQQGDLPDAEARAMNAAGPAVCVAP